MASPLSWFRHHQKGMLVVFGVLLMASFGLASVMTSLTPTGSRNEFATKPVVRYSGGTFTNSDFSNMRNRHFQTVNFLERFKQMLRASRPDFQERPSMIDTMNANSSPDEMNRQLMERFLALKRGESIGIVVSNQAVLEFLRNFASDETLTHYDFDRICLELIGNNVDFIDIREQLKEELAIQQVKQMYASGVPGVPSITEAWESFQKLENRIDCQIVGFPVKDFMEKVSETPTNSELRQLYEKGKYEFPDAAGESPGFKQRRKLAVSMLTANYMEFLERAKLAITPEQVTTEYDLLVSANSPIVTEIVPVPTEAGNDNSDGDDPPPNIEGDDPPAVPDSETTSGDSAPTVPETTEGGNGDAAESTAEPSNDSKTGDENPDDDSEKTDDGEAVSSYPLVSPLNLNTRFVSTSNSNSGLRQQEETGNPTPETQEKEQPATPESPTPAAEQEGENPTPQEIPPTTDEVMPGDQDLTVPVPPTADPPQIPGSDPLSVPDQQIETRIKPLDKALEDVIRGRLASRPAVEAMAISIAEATAAISEYGVDFEEYEQSKSLPAAERSAEPTPIDVTAIANKFHLKYKSQPLSDEIVLSESEVGKTSVSVEVETFFGMQERNIDVATLMFGKFHDLGTWQPETFDEYFANNQHVVFATEKSAPKILEFADAHADVEQYWKREKALELAKAAAQKVADQLNDSGQLLSVIDPAGVKNTGGFTWHFLQSGTLYPVFPGGIRPGEEFMEAAFALENNKAGVAPDFLRETVFVVQKIHLDDRTEEELEELFFQSMATNQGFGNNMGQLHQQQIRELSREFFDQLNDEYQVKWLGD